MVVIYTHHYLPSVSKSTSISSDIETLLSMQPNHLNPNETNGIFAKEDNVWKYYENMNFNIQFIPYLVCINEIKLSDEQVVSYMVGLSILINSKNTIYINKNIMDSWDCKNPLKDRFKKIDLTAFL